MTARLFFSVGQPGNFTIEGVEDRAYLYATRPPPDKEKRAVIDSAYNLSL
jgi:hypothetical protein